MSRSNFYRESFFKTLNTLGVLQALEITLAADNRQTKSASVDILLFIVDFSPSMVREYMLQQLNNTEDVSLFRINALNGTRSKNYIANFISNS